jgi:hypothetical protein
MRAAILATLFFLILWGSYRLMKVWARDTDGDLPHGP